MRKKRLNVSSFDHARCPLASALEAAILAGNLPPRSKGGPSPLFKGLGRVLRAGAMSPGDTQGVPTLPR
jgi:hypothetical protein